MLYNLLMTLLMTVIATALGTAQIVVHSSPLSTLSPAPLCASASAFAALWHCLLSVRVPDIAFTACSVLLRLHVEAFPNGNFGFSACSTVPLALLTPSPLSLSLLLTVTTFHIFGIGIFRVGCARVEFIGNFCRLHLQSID